MSDTFFSASPHWTWFIIPYLFIGGIAGGAMLIAAMLDLVGAPEDRRVANLGYYVAVVGAIISGALLTLDLGRPLRFWHMLLESETGGLMLKGWSPISFGAWMLTAFGLVGFVAAVGAAAEEGRIGQRGLAVLRRGPLGVLISVASGVLGILFAGYTGILLTVTNRPIWADNTWLGVLFLFSGASTAAATLVLLLHWRGVSAQSTVARLNRFDSYALVLEVLALLVFIVSLGAVARVWVSGWGLLLLLGVLLAGILVPLGLHTRPAFFGGLGARPIVNAAVLVLVGGFLLRIVVLLASNGIELRQVAEGG